ncbi:hypothetical protein [Nonomuraea wenchangensis]|uniref:Uncharacterized protein n=1 Tax=Nonomuraea wenchangensis TaxID=568860 RepID=A0A1I0ETR3_9ACTN|nr:hypothetical protein [Nonomuraea wenchangensis]SET48951.1 hypothetical protein SAMN05421811_103202 [Nonomuraea wenchangensis]
MDDVNALSKFNREDWADKPFLIELRGPNGDDGTRFRWHELPPMWRQPEARPLTTFEYADPWDSHMPVADYRPTGSVTDDGAHIYEFYQHE